MTTQVIYVPSPQGPIYVTYGRPLLTPTTASTSTTTSSTTTSTPSTSQQKPVSAVKGVQVKHVTRTRYITRYRTQVKTIVRYRTVTQVKTITHVKQVTKVRTVVNHKVVVTPKVRYVTLVRYQTKVLIKHKTVVTTVAGFRYLRHPKTGRFAGPLAPRTSASVSVIPPVEARMSISRLHISWAPVWARTFIAQADGSLLYNIVPAYGATRFAASAAFGQTGLTLISGHDDIYGNIFRYLDTMKPGDVITVWRGRHTFHYVVRTVQTVTPDNVGMLNAPRTTPTLALISCTPYWVDSHRVVVIATMQ